MRGASRPILRVGNPRRMGLWYPLIYFRRDREVRYYTNWGVVKGWRGLGGRQ